MSLVWRALPSGGKPGSEMAESLKVPYHTAYCLVNAPEVLLCYNTLSDRKMCRPVSWQRLSLLVCAVVRV